MPEKTKSRSVACKCSHKSHLERKVAGSSLAEGVFAFSPTVLKLKLFMCLFVLVVLLINVSVAD